MANTMAHLTRHVEHQQARPVEWTVERLGTGVRFIRRLISERRIRYAKLGKRACG
ncbi:hypothetical protein [Streptomyces sp. NPDC007369]|uniref:hypothetical protein n=1 Tax=Streptomyces sp. NPDC007369 TaxID=3154589 RepID=UPI0033C8DE92